jgi:hypothetical protein
LKTAVVLCSLVLSASMPALGAGPSSRIGEAEVREGANSVPCFTISADEERQGGTPNFDSVTVSESGGKGSVMWKMGMPPSRTFPVSFSMCIPYAGRVQALPQTPAARLEPGKVYQVRIDARRTKGINTPPVYEARFCLARQRGASVAVYQVGRNDPEARRLKACMRPPAL